MNDNPTPEDINEALQTLLSLGLVEMAWDEDENDFVFWMNEEQTQAFKDSEYHDGTW